MVTYEALNRQKLCLQPSGPWLFPWLHLLLFTFLIPLNTLASGFLETSSTLLPPGLCPGCLLWPGCLSPSYSHEVPSPPSSLCSDSAFSLRTSQPFYLKLQSLTLRPLQLSISRLYFLQHVPPSNILCHLLPFAYCLSPPTGM